MNKLLIVLLFPFVLPHFASLAEPEPVVEEIVWSSDRKLAWEDFKGTPKGNRITGAATYASIKAEPKVMGYWNNRVEVEVKAIFRCDRSWAKDQAKDSDYLLNHEQRHFDIAEIYANKIRETLQSYRITPRNYAQIKAEVIEQLFEAYVAYDEAYDRETVHGLSSGVQEQWDQEIDQQLEQETTGQ